MQDEDAGYLVTPTTSARRTMSREELYVLVWQTPLSRLAKSFGLSDVGLRKICVKHNIPTTKLGCWASISCLRRTTRATRDWPRLPILWSGRFYPESDAVDRLIRELRSFVAGMKQDFEREALQEEIVRLELYTEDDPVKR
jgi:hypothetical protein